MQYGLHSVNKLYEFYQQDPRSLEKGWPLVQYMVHIRLYGSTMTAGPFVQ
jgi:hypothetical protein